MGYRSHVAYSIAFPERDALSRFIATVMAVGGEHKLAALKECHIDWDDCEVNFEECDTKWYDGYESVDAHHALMQWAVEMDIGAGYYFARIGEELTDIETIEGGNMDVCAYENIEVIRHIQTSFDPRRVGDALSATPPDIDPEDNPYNIDKA